MTIANLKVATCDKNVQESSLALAIGDITKLIATLIDPKSELDDFELRAISLAFKMAYKKKENSTRIDDIRDALKQLASEKNNDKRYSNLAFKLQLYCVD